MADNAQETIRIDEKLFWERVIAFRKQWIDHRQSNDSLWSEVDAVCIATGKQYHDGSLSSELFLRHIFGGLLMTNTVVCLCEEKVVILSGKAKLRIIKTLSNSAPNDENIALELIELPKKDMKDAIEGTINFLRQSFSGQKVGALIENNVLGTFAANEWPEALKSAVSVVNCNRDIDLLLSVNTAAGLRGLEKCSELAIRGMKRIIKNVEKIFESEAKVSHLDLVKRAKNALENPVSGLKLSSAEWDKDEVFLPFDPSIMSGSTRNVQLGAASSAENISSDVILIQLGVQYGDGVVCVGRTLFVNGSSQQSKAYDVLTKFHKKLMEFLVPGNTLGAVYESAANYLQGAAPEYFEKMPKCLGYVSGPKLRFDGFSIASGVDVVLHEGMCLLISSFFEDLELTGDELTKKPTLQNGKYSCVITDSVVVRDNAKPKLITEGISALYDEVSYEMESEGEEDEEESEDAGEEDENEDQKLARQLQKGAGRITRASSKTPEQLAKEKEAANLEKKIAERQVALMQKKAKRAVRTEGGTTGDDEEETAAVDEQELLNAYPRGSRDYPKDMVRNQIYCDRENDAVLVPIGGFHIPFHISVIKTATKMEEEKATLLRLNFHYPTGSGTLNFARDVPQSMRNVMARFPDLSYIKELTFRCSDPRNLNHQYRVIKEMQKQVRQRQRIKEEAADLVEQIELKVLQSSRRPPELSEVSMRPPLKKGKCIGRLQAHANGFRFRTVNRETFDIIYSNIKHFIFQECKKELNVIIHLHLKNPLIVGRTKSHNIQFFTEVVEGSSALDIKRRSMHDPDEEEEERREQLLKRKLNRMFKQFCQEVVGVVKDHDETIGRDNDFDMPYRKLAFQGVPYKEMVWIIPTVHALVNLTETPFFVVTLEDIEHVHFERVTSSTKSFDMVIILKSHMTPNSGEPHRITSVPIDNLDIIRQWLHDLGNITFTSGTVSLAWKTVMLGVYQELENGIFWKAEDMDGEKKSIGWNFLAVEDEGGDSSDESEESSAYSASQSESSSSSEEDDWEANEEESSEEEAEDSVEEEGEDWDELERQAAADDKRKSFREHRENDDDEIRKKKARNYR